MLKRCAFLFDEATSLSLLIKPVKFERKTLSENSFGAFSMIGISVTTGDMFNVC